MLNFLSEFWKDEEGLETIEMLLILSVLVVVAIAFKDKIIEWKDQLFEKIDGEILK